MAEYKSYYEMRKDFFEKFKTKILPMVRRHEDERKRKLRKAIIIFTLLFIIGIFIIALSFLVDASSKSSENTFELGSLCICGAFLAWWCIKKDFENSIKEKIMPTVCSCFGDMHWHEGSYGASSQFTASYLIPQYSDSEYDDVFTGRYKDVRFDIVECKYNIGSGKNRRTVFDGVVIKLDMNKTFSSHTLIKADTFLHLSPSEFLRRTTLEDVAFEKNFDVFTNDEVDARYLITPSFMERLNNMKVAFSASSISCAFYGKHLLIALATPWDLFSLASLVTPITDAKQYHRMYEEIVSIIKLIDHFKLDQKIGL